MKLLFEPSFRTIFMVFCLWMSEIEYFPSPLQMFFCENSQDILNMGLETHLNWTKRGKK